MGACTDGAFPADGVIRTRLRATHTRCLPRARDCNGERPENLPCLMSGGPSALWSALNDMYTFPDRPRLLATSDLSFVSGGHAVTSSTPSPRATMASIQTAGEAVARIAYLSSDAIVDVRSSLSTGSEFSKHLTSYASKEASSIICKATPEVIPTRHNADPLLSVHSLVRHGKLTSVTTDSGILVKSIPHLYKLAQHPVVLHVSLQPTGYPDYADITSVRNTGFAFIQSASLQEAQDLALTAHALALRSGRGVIHFFDASNSAQDRPIAPEQREVVSQLLPVDLARQYQALKSDDANIYVSEGRTTQRPSPGIELNSSSNAANVPTTNGTSGVTSPREPSTASNSSSERKGSSSGVSEAESATTVESEPRPVQSEDVDTICKSIWSDIKSQTGRQYSAFNYTGPANATNVLFLFGSDPGLFSAEFDAAASKDFFYNVGLITPVLYRPWLTERLIEALPRSVKRIAVLEQIKRKTTKWGPVFLDLLMSLKSSSDGPAPTIVGYQLGYIEGSTVTQALSGIFQNLTAQSPIQNLEIGAHDGPERQKELAAKQPALENAYMKILDQLFDQRLYIANALKSSNTGITDQIRASPEFGFGSLIARKEHRKRFVSEVQAAAKTRDFTTDAPQKWLSDWALVAEEKEKANKIAPEVVARLSNDGSPAAYKLLSSKGLFFKESQWLVGSDAWAYDLGNSGVHHVLASGENVNMLIVDSTPYSERAAADAARRKKDIGLYAMNFGNAYVASTAVYSSYTQVLQAMMEAEQFNGPSVVLAYLPYESENDNPIKVLQETKKAVDLGYWPLYRWDPQAENRNEENFKLDSERIKEELKEFLARDNKLTQLMRRHPQFHSNLSESYGSEVRKVQKRKAKGAYEALLEGLQGAPMTVLFASDGGNAENLAKRLANRGKARGLKTYAMAMDDYPIEDLGTEENVVFISSTAGQGEFPQNGRNFWEAVKNSTDIDLAGVNYTVFALGDSHYWPRKEDKHYYNKPGKDLYTRLATLGGKQIVDCGLGDDQDPDGYQTGYQEWEPKLWDALGVGNVEGLPEEPPPMTNEDIKIQSEYLRGTIVEGLEDPSTGAISAADQQLTKFHGTYMQDDRDLRDERKAQGLEPAYSFMIRCRLPGGVATPDQWVQMDDIAQSLGNETMKLTTRQTFQFHGVVKDKLKPAMQAINRALMTTIAACGDVNRNVMCSSLPEASKLHGQAHEAAKRISDWLLPSTSAYHEIWLKGMEGEKDYQVFGEAVKNFNGRLDDPEPMYGPVYLPRKFKITIAVPPHNDTDVYAHDIGLIAIKDDKGDLAGFNVLAGGGMGATHNMKKTYPQVGRMFGYVDKSKVHIVCEKIMLVQRDNGDRKNRKQARLKYTIDRMGVENFKDEVEKLLEYKFEEPRPFKFASNVDTFGWLKDETGNNHFTMFIENGRIEDTAEFPMKTGLRAIAKANKGEFRLTGNQHLILSNIKDADLPQMKELLKKYKLDNTNFSGLRLSSSACVAFPTCGLAMAESERYLPELVTKLEGTLEENGLGRESIVMRMTGCPNGCARPWLAEVAFVGKAFGAYNMYLGGGYHGNRLNKLYRSSIKEEEILEIMKPLLKRYALERKDGERFGDFVIRIGVIVATTDGQNFHDNTAEVEEDDE
ncbi:Sulfite reductase [NADPH] subunit beta [Fulvia fulva]|uniref:Sulfite reductase [NADPH] subunit beta n=1 Tax=Passalora fulva TaxID=5499 RepID=A0A9Q8PDU0_PASFU|nr:Sulfite reductase [NADPH] subunit beta [Fulvia fulva]KAK4618658.1 Sulfite reductase [NADPH] subunit beta [Fulvia fulva]UJO20596.1 Sulfite reductase [NADPH] subunit beta [Fulvia fulva]WPV18295.1 Sulfite reductase [NADPH] subunit beta [Fulvia fulva]